MLKQCKHSKRGVNPTLFDPKNMYQRPSKNDDNQSWKSMQKIGDVTKSIAMLKAKELVSLSTNLIGPIQALIISIV